MDGRGGAFSVVDFFHKKPIDYAKAPRVLQQKNYFNVQGFLLGHRRDPTFMEKGYLDPGQTVEEAREIADHAGMILGDKQLQTSSTRT